MRVFFGIIGLLLVPFSVHAEQSYRIISRSEWGADESFLVVNGEPKSETADTANDKTSEPDTISQRQKECEENRKLYPGEFKAARTVTKDDQGRTYRWPLQYSKGVKLIVVHHTAIPNTGEKRSSTEQMRALYTMHANGKGWGDIGYHYVIGDDGKIYEGKAGGDYVVGGHVYCGNVGTVGIALMGNFEIELPTQTQMRSLQWLTARLQDTYNINPKGTVRFHGKDRPPVVGHRDLLSTDCPGYYVAETLDQVRTHVASNDLTASIAFPKPPKATSAGLFTKLQKNRKSGTQENAAGMEATGPTSITGRPGGTAIFLVRYRSGNSMIRGRTRIGSVQRSSARIGLTQELGGRTIPVRTDILLPEDLAPLSVQTIRLAVTYPNDPDTYTLHIGGVKYTLEVGGRRARNTTDVSDSLIPVPSSSNDAQSMKQSEAETAIRIRLSTREANALSCDAVDLQKLKTQYRGTLECTVIDGRAAIINSISLEDYLAGLAEEPDTEPYEKQRAFAIAARTYAAYYMQEKYRKFPGMPYDGDDSPARFQSYKGITFELKNPRWVKAVRSTTDNVLMIGDALIKPPYFSSDDGRTRSPEEAGWKNFPHAEIFKSKPDPWCKGMAMAGHGVGMSGCGAEGQANEGKTAERILEYYYPKTTIVDITQR